MPKVFWILFFTPVFPLLHTSPSWLPHLNSCLLHPHSSRELLSLSSLEVWRDATQKASRRWRAQHWRKVERRRQEEPFIPNAKVKRKVSSVLSLHFIFSMFFSFLCFRRNRRRLNGCCLFLSFFFCLKLFFFFYIFAVDKAMTTSFLPSLNFFFFLLEHDDSKLVVVIYFFFYCCYHEQGNDSKLATITHY